MKPLRHLALALIASAALSTPALAQDGATIAVVNIQKIMADATAAKDIRNQLEAKQKSYQADLKKKVEELQKEKQEIMKQQSVLSKDAFQEKAKAFTEKETAAQKSIQDKRASIDKATEKALSQIQKVTVDIIAELAKEKGFKIALPSSQVLYAETSMDISAEVLERLNKKQPKLAIEF